MEVLLGHVRAGARPGDESCARSSVEATYGHNMLLPCLSQQLQQQLQLSPTIRKPCLATQQQAAHAQRYVTFKHVT